MKTKVDILIPAYKEPLNVIERMFSACQKQKLMTNTDLKVWFCVDGMSESDEKNIDLLAIKYGISVSKRQSRNGFRAGALNYCIQNKLRKDSEYIIVLDIDQAPKTEMTYTLVNEMNKQENIDTHFIMFPQTAENAEENAISKASDILQKFDYYFNRRIRSETNSAFVVGTNWIAKTEFVRRIPFEEESIVEDQASSIKWHAEGAVIKVINTELANGLAPNSIDSWRAQQCRWSYGAMYNIRFLFKNWSKLSFWQKIDYTSVMMWYFYAIPTVLSIIIPLITFWKPLTSSEALLPIVLLTANITVFTYPIIYCRKPRLTIKEIFQTAVIQHMCLDLYLRSIWYNIIGRRFSYVVSDKSSKICKHPHKSLWFPYMLVTLTSIGMMYSLYLNPPNIERMKNALNGAPLTYTTYIIIWLVLGIFWIWGTIYYAHKSNRVQKTRE